MCLTQFCVHPRTASRRGDRRPRRKPVDRRITIPRRARRVRSCVALSVTESATGRTSSVAGDERRTTRGRLLLIAQFVVLALIVTGATAHAETITVLAQVQSVEQVLNNIRNWIMGILAGLATVFFSIGGVRRVMAAGDPGEQQKAKDCFKAAAIGYGLAVLAPLVVSVLKGIVGAP